MIESMIDGRMRIRDSKLKVDEFASKLKRHLSVAKGLKEILINQRVGSALIVYDASITSAERIIRLIGRFLDVAQKTEVPKVTVRKFRQNKGDIRRAVSIGLIASLSASLIALVFGSKALHIAFGLVFLGFAAIHILKYEKLLLV